MNDSPDNREIAGAKRAYGWPEEPRFLVPAEVPEQFARTLGARGRQARADWTRSVEDTRLESLGLVREMIGKDDFNEGVKSYLEKRTPRYKGLSHDPDSAEPIRPY